MIFPLCHVVNPGDHPQVFRLSTGNCGGLNFVFQLNNLLFQFRYGDAVTLNTVLLVDDDKDIRRMMREQLEKHDFLVLEAAAGKRLIQILEQQPVDIILLDLQLLDGSGLSFIPEIRKHTDAPLIIVSGRNETAGKVESLDKGADDYVHKPFDMDELMARIRASLRRHRSAPSNQNDLNGGARPIRFGGWILDQTRFQMFDKDNRPGNLTIKEFQLLEKLVVKAGQAVTREDLCEAIREKNYIPTKRAIDVKITRIRKKIGDDVHHSEIIKTVRGIGYMLNCDI